MTFLTLPRKETSLVSVPCRTAFPCTMNMTVSRIETTFLRNFSNSNFSYSLPELLIRNHFAVAILFARKVHQAGVVALFPSSRRFFSYVTVPISNDVCPPEQTASEAVTTFTVVIDKFRLRVFPVGTEHISIAFNLNRLRMALWIEQAN